MSSSTYTVTGMTCGNCVDAVKEEVGQLTGVSDVDVDLDTGLVTVTTDGTVDDSRIGEAVEEAGYQVAG